MKISISNIIESIISALLIAIIFFIWNDYFNTPSNLSGEWLVEDFIADSNYAPYKGMVVSFKIFLRQSGGEITGSGEKIAERISSSEEREISAKDRVELDIVGTLKNNFFSKDQAIIHLVEHGVERKTSTLMSLNINDARMDGEFTSTAGDSRGYSKWIRK